MVPLNRLAIGGRLVDRAGGKEVNAKALRLICRTADSRYRGRGASFCSDFAVAITVVITAHVEKRINPAILVTWRRPPLRRGRAAERDEPDRRSRRSRAALCARHSLSGWHETNRARLIIDRTAAQYLELLASCPAAAMCHPRRWRRSSAPPAMKPAAPTASAAACLDPRSRRSASGAWPEGRGQRAEVRREVRRVARSALCLLPAVERAVTCVSNEFRL